MDTPAARVCFDCLPLLIDFDMCDTSTVQHVTNVTSSIIVMFTDLPLARALASGHQEEHRYDTATVAPVPSDVQVWEGKSAQDVTCQVCKIPSC